MIRCRSSLPPHRLLLSYAHHFLPLSFARSFPYVTTPHTKCVHRAASSKSWLSSDKHVHIPCNNIMIFLIRQNMNIKSLEQFAFSIHLMKCMRMHLLPKCHPLSITQAMCIQGLWWEAREEGGFNLQFEIFSMGVYALSIWNLQWQSTVDNTIT